MSDEINEYFEAALELVKTAGNLIIEFRNGCRAYEQKSSDIDLVTEVDKNVEKTLMDGLSKKFPSHKFIGEETVSEGGQCVLSDDPTWIIDPVDGTLNFIHGYPQSCISVGLAINKECVAGIIYNPILDLLFTAQKGKGAFLNNRQIHVSQTRELSKALISFEAGTSRDPERIRVMFENFRLLVEKGHGVRTIGSAAMNMANVAMGGSDAYFEFGIHAWDIAVSCRFIVIGVESLYTNHNEARRSVESFCDLRSNPPVTYVYVWSNVRPPLELSVVDRTM